MTVKLMSLHGTPVSSRSNTKAGIVVIQGDWNAKVGEDAQWDWGEVCGPFCNPETKNRGLKLLDFATYNKIVLANTLGNHKPSRRWTWHSPDGTHHNHTDYLLVKKRFRSGTDTAAELLGKQRRKRKPWVTPEILNLCDQRRDLKKKRGELEGAKAYREIKRKIRTEMKMAKETWIQGQCQEVEACLRKNNSKKAYQLVKDLTTEKLGKSTTMQDMSRKCLTEENEILNRWTEYCSDLYNYETEGNPIVLDCPQIPDEEHHTILQEEVEAAVKALKMGQSAGVDNIPTELVQAGGEAMTDILTIIRNKIWKTWQCRSYGLNP